MTDLSLAAEDEAFIRDMLQARRDAGEENPLLPADVDLDGDGTADSFGLDAEGNVTVVSGAALADTVFESTGDDIVNSHEDLEWLEKDMGEGDG